MGFNSVFKGLGPNLFLHTSYYQPSWILDDDDDDDDDDRHGNDDQ